MTSNVDLISILENSNNLVLEDVCKLVNNDINNNHNDSDVPEYVHLLVMLVNARILNDTQQLIAYSILWNQVQLETNDNNICSIDWFVQRVHDYADDNIERMFLLLLLLESKTPSSSSSPLMKHTSLSLISSVLPSYINDYEGNANLKAKFLKQYGATIALRTGQVFINSNINDIIKNTTTTNSSGGNSSQEEDVLQHHRVGYLKSKETAYKANLTNETDIHTTNTTSSTSGSTSNGSSGKGVTAEREEAERRRMELLMARAADDLHQEEKRQKNIQIAKNIVENDKNNITTTTTINSSSSSSSSSSSAIPSFFRPAPPTMDLSPCELYWKDITTGHAFHWEEDMIRMDSSVAVDEIKTLVNNCRIGPLAPSQQQLITDTLDDDPRLLHLCGIDASSLVEVVEHNPAVASGWLERLVRLYGESHELVSSCMSSLSDMEVSLHSMEVMNRVASSVTLPADAVHVYVGNCIKSCTTIQDKYMQNRLVRLVCVFLRSLIRNNILDSPDMLAEITTFCVDFSRIREANSLYKLLKSVEGPEA